MKCLRCSYGSSQIIALFESSTHPEHTKARADQALQFVDRIITTTSLSMMDIDDPDVPTYSARSVPMVNLGEGYVVPRACGCIRGTVNSPPLNGTSERFSYSFGYNPPWDPQWPITEQRKEEFRRVCWSAVNLISNYTSQCAAFHQEPIELHLMEPANVSLDVSDLLCTDELNYDRTDLFTFPGRGV